MERDKKRICSVAARVDVSAPQVSRAKDSWLRLGQAPGAEERVSETHVPATQMCVLRTHLGEAALELIQACWGAAVTSPPCRRWSEGRAQAAPPAAGASPVPEAGSTKHCSQSKPSTAPGPSTPQRAQEKPRLGDAALGAVLLCGGIAAIKAGVSLHAGVSPSSWALADGRVMYEHHDCCFAASPAWPGPRAQEFRSLS